MIVELVMVVAGFATVMLACSLLVMYVVRLVHYLAGQRAKGLVAMLGQINLVYREAKGDKALEGDQAQANFILDVLAHRVIDPMLERAPTTPAAPGKNPSRKAANNIAKDRASIRREDMLVAVELMCERGADGLLVLPERWFFHVPPQMRTFADFKNFTTETFASMERASTVRFRLISKRMSILFSALFVVATNLNCFQIADGLVRDPKLREALQESAPFLLAEADDLGEPDEEAWFSDADERKRWLHEVSGKMTAVNTILSHDLLGLGWGGSHITKVFARAPYRAEVLVDEPRLSHAEFWREVSTWLIGLVVSWLLVAQGPAFWADILRRTSPTPDGATATKRE